MTSLKIFSVRGIDVKLHWTLLLLFGFFFVMSVFLSEEFDLFPIIWILILFASVALHELSHSLVARDMGIVIDQIILLPIGGMAVMKQSVFSPKMEFKMALAGPLFNFAFCYVLLVFRLLTGWDWLLYNFEYLSIVRFSLEPALLLAFVVSAAFWLNFVLGMFNLFLPAIPMDGGRIFRSFLAMFMDYIKATRIATTVSNILMLLLLLFSFYTGQWLMALIAVFIFLASRAELEATVSNRLLGEFPLSKLVRQNYLIVDDDDTLDHVLGEMIASRSLVAFYTEEDKIYSVNIYDIRGVPKSLWKKVMFSKVAREQRPVTADHTASFALQRMLELNQESLSVVDKKNEIIGCVFKEDIHVVLELLKISKL